MTDIFKGGVGVGVGGGTGLISDGEREVVQGSRAARRKRMEIRSFKFVAGVSAALENTAGVDLKRRRSFPAREFEYAVDSYLHPEKKEDRIAIDENNYQLSPTRLITKGSEPVSAVAVLYGGDVKTVMSVPDMPRFGITSVCGRRRDMEDAVAVYPSFVRNNSNEDVHYFAVYDGHGCSHVAMRCRERLHELVREEILAKKVDDDDDGIYWKQALQRCFIRMDKEVESCNEEGVGGKCRCELQMPECDAVGSTAVVAIVTPRKIIVANCGDSRAVLCRKGKPVALSSDHKPDRPDELNRIQEAGGRVIYWDGPRVLGVLGMSRAIGDNYLKPYVIPEPEVTITDRTGDDECLVLASDGLWDVVSNANACSVARMCLHGKVKRKAAAAPPVVPSSTQVKTDNGGKGDDKACSAASMLLTKLALSRQSSDNVSVVVVDLRRNNKKR